MNATGDSKLLIEARSALLDALQALDAHCSNVIVIGAQAIYLRKQPGSWLSPKGIPVDLMVPEALAGASGRRGARIPPHSTKAARRAVGLEAAVVRSWRARLCHGRPRRGRSRAARNSCSLCSVPR